MRQQIITSAVVAMPFGRNVGTAEFPCTKKGLPAARISSQWRLSEVKVRAKFEARHVGDTGPDADGEDGDRTRRGSRPAVVAGEFS